MTFDLFVQIMSMNFMVRAMIVGLMVSLCAALLGVNLVLKRYAMIGTSLSHVSFAAAVIIGAVGIAPTEALNNLVISMLVVVAAAFLMLRLSESSKVKGDSVVALVSTSSLAVGVIIVSQTTGITLHICNVMFGSILATTWADTYVSIILSVAVLGLFVFFYKQLFAVTYDENFAKATGTKVEIYKSMLAILTAVTVVLGMRMMGALLIAALTVFPALTAMCLCKRFLSVIITAAVVGVVSFFVGMSLAVWFEGLPPGASVVGVNLAIFAVFNVIAFAKRGIAR